MSQTLVKSPRWLLYNLFFFPFFHRIPSPVCRVLHNLSGAQLHNIASSSIKCPSFPRSLPFDPSVLSVAPTPSTWPHQPQAPPGASLSTTNLYHTTNIPSFFLHTEGILTADGLILLSRPIINPRVPRGRSWPTPVRRLFFTSLQPKTQEGQSIILNSLLHTPHRMTTGFSCQWMPSRIIISISYSTQRSTNIELSVVTSMISPEKS